MELIGRLTDSRRAPDCGRTTVGGCPTSPRRPRRSLVADGEFRFGTYDGPVADVNLLDRWHGPAQAWHRSRLKEWQAFQLGNDEYFVLGAVYDAKLLGLLQIVAVHMATGTVHRWEHKVPSRSLTIATGLAGTHSTGSWRGLSITVDNDLPRGQFAVHASQELRSGHRPDGTVGAMRLEVAGRCGPGEAGHLVICHPFADGTPLYSHKCVMTASATLSFDGNDVDFDEATSFLILDDHKGHYPSPMQYDWVTGARHAAGGPRLAFNLTANQVIDPERYNENAVFLDDQVYRLPAVTFTRPHGVHRPWHVADREGRVAVTFEPTVPNEQHVGPRSFLADYYGPFGHFDGAIELEDGRSIDVSGCYGMGEQKFIRF